MKRVQHLRDPLLGATQRGYVHEAEHEATSCSGLTGVRHDANEQRTPLAGRERTLLSLLRAQDSRERLQELTFLEGHR